MSENRNLVEKHINGFNSGDMDLSASAFSPDVVSTDPGAGTINGLEAFRAYAESFKRAFPDGKLSARRWVEDGDTIVIEGVYSGTHTGPLASPQGEVPPTGRKLDLPHVDLYVIEAGRICQHHVYYDQMTFAAQLGLLPEPSASQA